MNENPGLLKRASRRINLFPTVANMAPLFRTPLSQTQLPAEPGRDKAVPPRPPQPLRFNPSHGNAGKAAAGRADPAQRRRASVPELNSGSRGTSPRHHRSGGGRSASRTPSPRAPQPGPRPRLGTAAGTPRKAACGGHGVLPRPKGQNFAPSIGPGPGPAAPPAAIPGAAREPRAAPRRPLTAPLQPHGASRAAVAGRCGAAIRLALLRSCGARRR